ncbi:MAG: quinone oxidoreductase [Rhodospirillales bacterium]|jgi:NADPH2:quinone reductase|nr:quinone oxidoreductase [Rhodospirillaceae bacterium]MDP6430619.1 quinone oxidoreductase [Rhodospirillales bacterium]MDP6645023.1 quinone oxidoreductase [Rhodospirillales bacterium]MDP6843597.1 quinone oxidoreductase [Rhodospirillales bacterium]
MKARAIRIHKNGPPSVLKWDEIDVPNPKPDQVLVRHTAVGFNFADTYYRNGLYKVAGFPAVIGIEGAGVIEAAGKRVKGYKAGDRVAFGGAGAGTYAEASLRGIGELVKLPRWLDDKTAAAALIKGCTVQYLFNQSHKLKKGETILFHAAAGGVGLIASQWARAAGARLIGTASTPAKARLAKRNGAAHVIVSGKQDIAKEVKRLTNGEGVDVVYDSVGHDQWAASLASVRKYGLVVLFGSASGKAPPLDLWEDGAKTASYFLRAKAANYLYDADSRGKAARHLFRMIKSGAIKIKIGQTYALKDAARAHRDAEARKTTGSTILLP